MAADDALQSLRYSIGEEREARVQGGVISLGTLDAGAEREVVILGTVVSPIVDRTEIRLSATLSANETPALALGTLTLTARSRARFSLGSGIGIAPSSRMPHFSAGFW